ncbi:YheC/YheD family protein [Paenibacillus sp. N1-5-1-14]|uniref:YheC/YheD family protein n=1 Tax=Paenibacillus radicibacter TaxID=2972488 RepID=UPI002158FC0E|nr:YheC/YheD family protein [Paenibacillus radicibacter]MCR8644131.1 YheC/YheD family protein [Paenibacillus radicibacter]
MSKWGLHTFFDRNKAISSYLPRTALLDPNTLSEYLNTHQSVFIKPNTQHRGVGILKAWKTANGEFSTIRIKGKTHHFPTTTELYNHIVSTSVEPRYVIQQAIPLSTINKRPYDIRSMMMRVPGGNWEFYGLIAKVAGPTSVITNVSRSRGYALPFDEALKQSLQFKPEQITAIRAQLIDLSVQICNHFNRYKSRTTQIGIDFALDKNGNIWIIEVNFDFPSHLLFARLPNRSTYRAIRRMAATIKRLRGR